MRTKLTLSIDEQVVESAKKYASGKGKSLSGIVENYLKLISNTKSSVPEIAPRIKKLMGSLHLPKEVNHKYDLGKEMRKKYSK
jgi:hypothetical protein